MWCVLIAYGGAQAWRGARKDWRNVDARAVLMGFFVLTALYLYVVGTALELGENYRYRYNIEPLFLAVAAVAVTDFVRAVRARVIRSRAS
jgi:hypothetical protein